MLSIPIFKYKLPVCTDFIISIENVYLQNEKNKRVQIRNTDASSDIIHLEASSQVVIKFTT